MNSLFDKLNLRPNERRLVGIVAFVVFIVLNWIFVWPHFGDWSKIQNRQKDANELLRRYRIEVDNTPRYQKTMADLEKQVKGGRTPEEVVGLIAAKTANLTADPNAHHRLLVVANLLGRHTLMDGRPHVQHGRPVKTSEGRLGIVFDEAPEADALQRWQRGRFLEVEREFARDWREALRRQRVRRMSVAELFPQGRPRTLEQVKAYADGYVRQQGGPAFMTALNILRVPRAPRGAIFLRWLAAGAPPIARFAPYAAYVATVQLFFQLSVSLDLISGDRASNAADIAYLFYLPFCMIFTSNDKLHSRTVPLFLRDDQLFVPGVALRADIQRLDQHFSSEPQEVLDRGVMYFDPPFDGDYLTTALWKRFLPGWRERRGRLDVPRDKSRDATLIEQLRREMGSPETAEPVNVDDAAFVAMPRVVPVKMGQWRILPQDVADRAAEHKKAQTGPPSSDAVS